MDIKVLFAIISVIVSVGAFTAYVKDIFLKKTQPHVYTWLIWAITQGTATAGLWYGGGGLGAIELTIGTLGVIGVFIFALHHGTKNITAGDTVVLIFALLAIVAWWQLKSPLLAVFMVSAIDVFGYIPTFRKSFEEPWSETLATWIAFTIGNAFAIFALGEYNLLTMTYLIAISTANIILVAVCLSRRPHVPKPA